MNYISIKQFFKKDTLVTNRMKQSAGVIEANEAKRAGVPGAMLGEQRYRGELRGVFQDGRGVRCGDHLSPHKYIYMWNNSYRTPTERWQKTSDFPKGKELPTYLGRAKGKRKNRHKRIGMGPAPLGGSSEGGKLSTH